MQNGPMMGRMVGQQHMLRGPHLMGAAGGAGGPGNGPGGGGPRMQNPNMQMGECFPYRNVKDSLTILFLSALRSTQQSALWSGSVWRPWRWQQSPAATAAATSRPADGPKRRSCAGNATG